MDSSESIGSTNFALAKDFIITVIDRLAKDQQVKVSASQSPSEFCALPMGVASVACIFVLLIQFTAKKHFATCLETLSLGKIETAQK